MGKYMSKYMELVAGKNRFLDCLIDKLLISKSRRKRNEYTTYKKCI